ncbi:MAG TPA: erythromycin esterase family protein, partial [Noviherbaspirillum sp.]
MNTALQTRVRERMHMLTRHGDARELDPVLEAIGDAEVVLLGEATHGTREFYRYRTRISQRLIAERGFDAIAVEADWPDALVVDRHVRGDQDSAHGDDARQALSSFERFPRWMWRNEETVSLVRWLGTHNRRQDASHRCGFFGLDLYSLRRSMQAVVAYLEQVDPEAAHRARHRYACFDHLADDPQRYGYTTSFGLRPDCEDAVVEQLMQMERQNYGQLAASDHDEAFFAEQNARVAQNAEAYYRAMFQGRHTSWNLRDTHMADTLAALRDHLSMRKGRPARIVVWAHNSHIGDARATE